MLWGDDFTGTDGAGWNAAKWITSANGSVAVPAILTNRGEMQALPTGNTNCSRAVARHVPIVDCEAFGTFEFQSGFNVAPSVILRGDGVWQGSGDPPNCVSGLRWIISNTGGSVSLDEMNNSTGTGYTSAAFDTSAGGVWNWRMQAIGDVYRGKIWQGSEPGTWTITNTVTARFSAGLLMLSQQSDKNVYVDNVFVRTPAGPSFPARSAGRPAPFKPGNPR